MQDLQIEYNKNEQRVEIMIEHLKNVDAELIHTQALYNAKKKEMETEEHLIKLSNKESGKLNDDLKAFQKKIFDYQYKVKTCLFYFFFSFHITTMPMKSYFSSLGGSLVILPPLGFF